MADRPDSKSGAKGSSSAPGSGSAVLSSPADSGRRDKKAGTDDKKIDDKRTKKPAAEAEERGRRHQKFDSPDEGGRDRRDKEEDRRPSQRSSGVRSGKDLARSYVRKDGPAASHTTGSVLLEADASRRPERSDLARPELRRSKSIGASSRIGREDKAAEKPKELDRDLTLDRLKKGSSVRVRAERLRSLDLAEPQPPAEKVPVDRVKAVSAARRGQSVGVRSSVSRKTVTEIAHELNEKEEKEKKGSRTADKGSEDKHAGRSSKDKAEEKKQEGIRSPEEADKRTKKDEPKKEEKRGAPMAVSRSEDKRDEKKGSALVGSRSDEQKEKKEKKEDKVASPAPAPAKKEEKKDLLSPEKEDKKVEAPAVAPKKEDKVATPAPAPVKKEEKKEEKREEKKEEKAKSPVPAPVKPEEKKDDKAGNAAPVPVNKEEQKAVDAVPTPPARVEEKKAEKTAPLPAVPVEPKSVPPPAAAKKEEVKIGTKKEEKKEEKKDVLSPEKKEEKKVEAAVLPVAALKKEEAKEKKEEPKKEEKKEKKEEKKEKKEEKKVEALAAPPVAAPKEPKKEEKKEEKVSAPAAATKEEKKVDADVPPAAVGKKEEKKEEKKDLATAPLKPVSQDAKKADAVSSPRKKEEEKKDEKEVPAPAKAEEKKEQKKEKKEAVVAPAAAATVLLTASPEKPKKTEEEDEKALSASRKEEKKLKKEKKEEKRAAAAAAGAAGKTEEKDEKKEKKGSKKGEEKKEEKAAVVSGSPVKQEKKAGTDAPATPSKKETKEQKKEEEEEKEKDSTKAAAPPVAVPAAAAAPTTVSPRAARNANAERTEEKKPEEKKEAVANGVSSPRTAGAKADEKKEEKEEDNKPAAATAAAAAPVAAGLAADEKKTTLAQSQKAAPAVSAAAAASLDASKKGEKVGKVPSSISLASETSSGIVPEFVEEGALSPRSRQTEGTEKKEKKEKKEKTDEEKLAKIQRKKAKQEEKERKEREKQEEKERKEKEKQDEKERKEKEKQDEKERKEREKFEKSTPRGVVVNTPRKEKKDEKKGSGPVISAPIGVPSNFLKPVGLEKKEEKKEESKAGPGLPAIPVDEQADRKKETDQSLADAQAAALRRPETARVDLVPKSTTGSVMSPAKASPDIVRRTQDDNAIGRVRGLTELPAPVRPSEDPNETKQQRQRKLIMTELLNTERDYVRDLVMIREVYLMPLRERKLLTEPVINAIFSNVTTLFNLNKLLLKELTDSISAHNGDTIGACFLRLVDYLRMYSQYCTNQDTAISILQENIQSNSKLKGNQNLGSYLIRPVQRLCKYPLLLRELLKVTEPSHTDYSAITLALSKIEAVVTQVNTLKKKHESSRKLEELQRRLVQPATEAAFNPIAPNRTLLREGSLERASRKDPSKQKEVALYLFNDHLVLFRVKAAKSEGTPAPLKLDTVWALSKGTLAAEAADATLLITFTPGDSAPAETMRLVASSEECSAWVRDIRTAAQASQAQSAADARKSEGGEVTSKDKRERVMAPWLEQFTAGGHKFYYNRETKESAWELPQHLRQLLDEHGFLLDDPAVPRTPSSLPPPATPPPIFVSAPSAPSLDTGPAEMTRESARKRGIRKSASIQTLSTMQNMAQAGVYDV